MLIYVAEDNEYIDDAARSAIKHDCDEFIYNDVIYKAQLRGIPVGTLKRHENDAPPVSD